MFDRVWVVLAGLMVSIFAPFSFVSWGSLETQI